MKKIKLLFKPLVIILLSAILFFSFFNFINETNQLNTNQVLEHLKDVGKQEANNCNQLYDNFKNIIISTSNLIGNSFKSENDIGNILNNVRTDKNYFKRLWYVNDKKELHNYKDDSVISVKHDYINEIFKGKTGITDVIKSEYNGKDIVAIYAPVFNQNVVVGGVIGIIEINQDNDQYIYNDVFNNKSYVFTTSTRGEIISKIRNSNTIYYGNNYFDFLKNDVSYNCGSYGQVINDIEKNQSGFITYTKGEQTRMVYYTPVKINNWYIFTAITTDMINDQNNNMNKSTLILILEILFVLAIMMFMIIRYYIKINKIKNETNLSLKTNNRKFDIVLKQISDRIFEYDIVNDSLTLDAWNDYPKILLNHFISNLHNYNFVCKEDEETLRENFNKIINGEDKVEFDAKLPYISKDFETWYHISMIYDNESKHAIGTLKNSTKEMKEYLSLLQDNMFKNSIYSDSLFMFAVNMKSKNVVIFQEQGSYHNVIDVDYDEYLMNNLIDYIHKSDKDRVKNFFNYDNIIRVYYDNKSSKIEFRYLNHLDKKYYWIRCRVRFERQSSNNELLMIVYANDIDEEKKKQLEIEFKAKRDGLTELYNRETFNSMVEKYISKNRNISNYCAYLIIDLDNFKSVNDDLGHSIGDNVLISVSEILDDNFDYNGYVGRFGGDEFVAFLYHQESYSSVEEKVKDVLKLISEIEIDENHKVSASIGIKYVVNEKTNIELFDKADKALYVAKKNGKNKFQVFFENMK